MGQKKISVPLQTVRVWVHGSRLGPQLLQVIGEFVHISILPECRGFPTNKRFTRFPKRFMISKCPWHIHCLLTAICEGQATASFWGEHRKFLYLTWVNQKSDQSAGITYATWSDGDGKNMGQFTLKQHPKKGCQNTQSSPYPEYFPWHNHLNIPWHSLFLHVRKNMYKNIFK